MNRFDVLERPVTSEKSGILRDEQGKYIFRVALRASKAQIKKAVEQMFDVKVVKVNSAVVRGHPRRRGFIMAKRKNFKKAFITLEQGSKIDLFEDN